MKEKASNHLKCCWSSMGKVMAKKKKKKKKKQREWCVLESKRKRESARESEEAMREIFMVGGHALSWTPSWLATMPFECVFLFSLCFVLFSKRTVFWVKFMYLPLGFEWGHKGVSVRDVSLHLSLAALVLHLPTKQKKLLCLVVKLLYWLNKYFSSLIYYLGSILYSYFLFNLVI